MPLNISVEIIIDLTNIKFKITLFEIEIFTVHTVTALMNSRGVHICLVIKQSKPEEEEEILL